MENPSTRGHHTGDSSAALPLNRTTAEQWGGQEPKDGGLSREREVTTEGGVVTRRRGGEEEKSRGGVE